MKDETRIWDSRVRRLHLTARRAVEDWLGGAYHSVFKGLGIAFEEVREYQPGDDVRTIDWNVTARTGTPFVKRFVEERELTVMIAVDARPTMRFGSGSKTKLQLAAEACAALVLAALRNNDRVGAIFFDGRVEKIVPPRKGLRHGLRLFRDLLRTIDGVPFSPPIRPMSGPGLDAAFETLHRVLHRRALVVLASDLTGDAGIQSLKHVAVRHDVVTLFVSDDWERSLPDVGLVNLRSPDGAAETTLDTRDSKVREIYRQRMDEQVAALRHQVRRAGADWLELITSQDPLNSLRRFFDRRASSSRSAR